MQLPLRIAQLEQERFWLLSPQCPLHFLRWWGCFPKETCNTSKTNIGCPVWSCLGFRAGFAAWTNARLKAKFKKVKIHMLHIQEYIKENEAPAAIPRSPEHGHRFTGGSSPSPYLFWPHISCKRGRDPAAAWGAAQPAGEGLGHRESTATGQNTIFLNFL